MKLANAVLLTSLLTINFAFADRRNPGVDVPTKKTPDQVKKAQKAAESTRETKVEELNPSAGARRLGAPTTGDNKFDTSTNPRGTVHVTPGSATKFDGKPLESVVEKAANGRPTTAETTVVRETEEPGKLTPGTITRNDLAIREELYQDPAFAEATGRLKDLLAREKSLTEAERNELTKLKLEIAEMIKVQADLDVRGKGSAPGEMVKAISKINDAIAERMKDIEKAVADARASGKIVDPEVVANLQRNIIDTYAGLGYNGGKKGSELLGLNKALSNIVGPKALSGEQLVGYMKYLDAYGSAYRKFRADGNSEETSHHLAMEARRQFVNGRAPYAKSEALQNKLELNKKLCECTYACAA